MQNNPKLDVKFTLFITLTIASILWYIGPDLSLIMTVLLLFDFTVAIIVIVRGLKIHSPGLIAGGAMCGLIALSTVDSIDEPTIGKLSLQVLGGVMGLSSFIIDRFTNTLDR